MNFFRLLALFLVSMTVILISCGDDKTANPVNPFGDYLFRCDVSGEQNFRYQSNVIQLLDTTHNGKTERYISSSLTKDGKEYDFQIRISYFTTDIMSYSLSSDSDAELEIYTGTGKLTYYKNAVGTVIFSKITGDSISGTFNLTIEDNNGKKITAKDGYFLIP